MNDGSAKAHLGTGFGSRVEWIIVAIEAVEERCFFCGLCSVRGIRGAA